ncbi:hypothetical protein B0H19DRAFT_376802 [Mycena capillaripes]|nr:hypothetical protein B0H19DRAFT_376802 [Mycena capillaripes]
MYSSIVSVRLTAQSREGWSIATASAAHIAAVQASTRLDLRLPAHQCPHRRQDLQVLHFSWRLDSLNSTRRYLRRRTALTHTALCSLVRLYPISGGTPRTSGPHTLNAADAPTPGVPSHRPPTPQCRDSIRRSVAMSPSAPSQGGLVSYSDWDGPPRSCTSPAVTVAGKWKRPPAPSPARLFVPLRTRDEAKKQRKHSKTSQKGKRHAPSRHQTAPRAPSPAPPPWRGRTPLRRARRSGRSLDEEDSPSSAENCATSSVKTARSRASVRNTMSVLWKVVGITKKDAARSPKKEIALVDRQTSGRPARRRQGVASSLVLDLDTRALLVGLESPARKRGIDIEGSNPSYRCPHRARRHPREHEHDMSSTTMPSPSSSSSPSKGKGAP